jgi:putative pyruvate formate lyase activating enzyme
VPLVYNTGGYDSIETLALLDGVFDIYMPDMKYGDAAVAERYSGVVEYPAINQAAVTEMHRQVGDLALDERGIAQRGLLVRHLVLPEGLAGTAEVVSFLGALSRDTYLNLMDQYRPCYQASELPPLDRRITRAEYLGAVRLAHETGLHRLDDRARLFAQPGQLERAPCLPGGLEAGDQRRQARAVDKGHLGQVNDKLDMAALDRALEL